MAVTITRTPWIDDDGSGTVGTVINNAVKTSIYNEIDGALAKVAQVAGGNTLTGIQTLATGLLIIGGTTQGTNELLSIQIDGDVNAGLAIINRNPSNTAYFIPFFGGGGATLLGYIAQNGASQVVYATSSDARLKEDAGRATDLSALRAVVVHDFTWKGVGVRDRGIFAQEAHALYPRAVSPGTDETTARGDLARPWMIDYAKFVSDLIVGWQQHDADIGDLRAQVATLKGSTDAQ